MPDVVLTFTDHEKWKFYFQTQGATTRSLVAFRRARPFPGGQVKEYLTYRFTMSSMPTFGVACGVTVSKIVHPEVTHTFTVVCLLVDNILAASRTLRCRFVWGLSYLSYYENSGYPIS
jgi:hypothetical protein